MTSNTDKTNIDRINPDKISAIQGARALAASAVAFFHIITSQSKTDAQHMWLAHFDGSWGVDLFFVISGFIMMYITRDTERGSRASTRYLYRRLTRIVPLYWFYTILTVLLGVWLLAAPVAWSKLIKSLLFVPDGFPALMVGWTLNYEVYFYLLFAVTLLLPQRLRVAFLSLWFVATCAAGFWHGHPGKYWINKGFSFYTAPIVFEFLAGVYIAQAAFAGKFFKPTFSVALIVLSLIAIFAAYLHFGDMELYRAYWWGIPAALIIHAVLSLQHHGWQTPRACEKLGDRSYSLYLCHLPVCAVLVILWRHTGASGYAANAAFIALAIAAALVATELSYRLVEQPIEKMLRGR